MARYLMDFASRPNDAPAALALPSSPPPSPPSPPPLLSSLSPAVTAACTWVFRWSLCILPSVDRTLEAWSSETSENSGAAVLILLIVYEDEMEDERGGCDFIIPDRASAVEAVVG